MIGTLRTTSDSSGAYTANRVYTAFGEEITNNTDRYGYVGDWGYQSHAEMPYQHVGARYYDPSTGRFLQRDPIGIAGGLNVYAYVLNAPTIGIDPTGHTGHGWWDGIKIGLGAVGELVAYSLIFATGATALTIGAGVVLAAVSAYAIYDGIRGIWPTATGVVAPLVPPANRNKRRQRRFEDGADYPSRGRYIAPGSIMGCS